MRAIHIDPIHRSVASVEYSGDYQQIYHLIDCDTFDVARINNKGDGIFVDDEGLFKEHQTFFYIEGYPQPLAGKGLMLGTDAGGESVEPTLSTDEVRHRVHFVTPLRTGNGNIVWVEQLEDGVVATYMFEGA